MGDLLIVARGVHFAATATVTGVALFQYLIAEPAFRTGRPDPAGVKAYLERLRVILLIALALVVLSGGAWFIALAVTIGDRALPAVISNGTIWLLLTKTQFGHVWLTRFALAALLLGFLALPKGRVSGSWWETLSAILTACLMGSLAGAGHAAATPGVAGDVHLTADILHLVAAGAWLGGLLPFWLLFSLATRQADRSLDLTVQTATYRFSTLGLLAVAMLFATGLVNTWMLVGSPAALFETDYGRLLLLKIALFAAMVAVAGVNRFRLTPRLPEKEPMCRLGHNVLIEIGLGLAIIVIVSLLGVLPPALHAGMHMQ
jgi:putative copper resistance protein D